MSTSSSRAALVADDVVLVDDDDRSIGTAEKLRAHRTGQLHRAFSVFVFDPQGQLLLQRRAAGKYHSAGLWTNTCCGHPRPAELTRAAATRRLREEMGFHCPLEHVHRFRYHARVADGLWEHELDHVFVGTFSGQPAPAREEVDAWRWCTLPDVVQEWERTAENFTVWFAPALQAVLASGHATAAHRLSAAASAALLRRLLPDATPQLARIPQQQDAALADGPLRQRLDG